MKQKQAKPEGGKPETAETLAGNKLAEMMGNKAREALKATIVVAAPVERPRLSQIAEYLNSIRTVVNVHGDYGGETIATVRNQLGCACHPESVRQLIEKGLLDEETFRLTDKTERQGLMICVCLKIGCGIGPFIPFRA